MDKTKKYIIEYNEEHCAWIATSEDLQEVGSIYDDCLEDFDKDLAPGLALMDLAGYDIETILEKFRY